MLIIILYYVLITSTCLWAGFLTDCLLSGLFNQGTAPDRYKHWIIYACWGVVSMTLFAQLLELFTPVNPGTWLLFVVILSIITALNKGLFTQLIEWLRAFKPISGYQFTLCALLVVLFAMLAAGPIQMDDTESYHMQIIKWTQAYGTVKGLANLHERFGFNSSWLTFTSFFIPPNSTRNYFTIANSLLSLWFSICLFTRSRDSDKWKEGPAMPGACFSFFFMFIVALVIWPMLRGSATNTNYDFITCCMISVLFLEVLMQKSHWQRIIPELLVWPVFLFTVRIINFPLLLITLFAMAVLVRQKKAQFLMISVGVLAIVVSSFLTRNVLLSGYLFYPAYQLDVFPVDWKADPELTKNLVTFIRYFNRVNTGFQPMADTAKLGFPEWIPVWLHYLFSYDKVLLILGISGYSALLSSPKWRRHFNVPAKVFLGVFALQALSWFLVAPDPRFIYGPLLVGTFFVCSIIPVKWVELVKSNSRIMPALSIVLICMMAFYIAVKVVRDRRYYNPVFPVLLPVPQTRVVKIETVEYRIPERLKGNWNPRCCATPLPCLYNIQPGLSLRGRTIEEGFKLKK